MFLQTSVCPRAMYPSMQTAALATPPVTYLPATHITPVTHTTCHTHSAATQPPVTHPHPGTLLCHTPPSWNTSLSHTPIPGTLPCHTRPVTNTLLPRSRGGHRSERYASFSYAFFFRVILTRCLELISFRQVSKQSTLSFVF